MYKTALKVKPTLSIATTKKKSS